MSGNMLATITPLVLLLLIMAIPVIIAIRISRRRKTDQAHWTKEELDKIEEYKRSLLRERQGSDHTDDSSGR